MRTSNYNISTKGSETLAEENHPNLSHGYTGDRLQDGTERTGGERETQVFPYNRGLFVASSGELR